MLRLFLMLLILIMASSAWPDQTDTNQQSTRKKRPPDKLYSEASSITFNHGPNAFLVEMVKGLKPGKALDVGMGQGRNALFLAQQGWDVTGFDRSGEGIRQALEQAGKLKVHINAEVKEADDFDFGSERWDLVVLCYIDSRSFLDKIRRSLKPGGAVILEYYHRDTRKMRYLPGDKAFATNELLQIFSDFRILHYEDLLAKPDWNFGSEDQERLVRIMAQKNLTDPVVNCTMQGKVYQEGEEACQPNGDLKLKCGKTGWDRTGSCFSREEMLRIEDYKE